MQHPALASITLAPAPSTATAAAKPGSALEQLIGEIVAQAVAVIAVGLDERANGGLRPKTRLTGGDLIAQLYALREVYLAERGALDFNCAAREYGKRVIAAHYAVATRDLGHPVAKLTDVMLDVMVKWPLDILAGVVRSQSN